MPLLYHYRHYLGWALLLVMCYFFVLTPTLDWLGKHTNQRPQVVYVEPTPSNVTTRTVANVTAAAKDKAVIAALENKVIQLSASQQTIAHAMERAGLNGKFASAASEGLTRPHPASEVIGVTTKTTVSPPPAKATDDQIERSLKKVLKETTIKTDNHVTVSWQDRPESPIFAAYSTDGSSGIGYTVKRAPALNLDALFMVTTNSMKVGAGVEHPIKGTAAGVGIDALVDTHTHAPTFGVFLGIHN